VLGDPATPAALGAVRVHSLSELTTQLPTVLDRALNHYLSIANGPPPPGSSAARPRLHGPGSNPPQDRTAVHGRL
jgi:hypothetical protein